jgi:hypothetical protein
MHQLLLNTEIAMIKNIHNFHSSGLATSLQLIHTSQSHKTVTLHKHTEKKTETSSALAITVHMHRLVFLVC